MITKEKLESYYTPRTAEESAAIRRRLADVLPGGDIQLHSNLYRNPELKRRDRVDTRLIDLKNSHA